MRSVHVHTKTSGLPFFILTNAASSRRSRSASSAASRVSLSFVASAASGMSFCQKSGSSSAISSEPPPPPVNVAVANMDFLASFDLLASSSEASTTLRSDLARISSIPSPANALVRASPSAESSARAPYAPCLRSLSISAAAPRLSLSVLTAPPIPPGLSSAGCC